MTFSVNFIERKNADTLSLEKVFRQVAKGLSDRNIETKFEKLPFGNSAVGTLKNLLFYRSSRFDIYHITGHVHYIALALPKERTVLTIHDLGILKTRTGLKRYVLKKLLFDWPVKKLRYITVISEQTKKELIEQTECPEEKIFVIENPLLDVFVPQEKRFNAQYPTILQIGTAGNKNISNLLRALEAIDCKLHIVGPLGEAVENELNDRKIDFENSTDLTGEEMRAAYADADIVTFCSTYEGFGLPIIEAQAMQTPVVTSDINPMRDIAGGGAILVDPNNHLYMRDGILRLIAEPELRKAVVEKGVENVKRFSPERITSLYENLYKTILAANVKVV